MLPNQSDQQRKKKGVQITRCTSYPRSTRRPAAVKGHVCPMRLPARDLSWPADLSSTRTGPDPVAAVTGRQLLLPRLFACMIAPRAPALMSATSRSHTASPRGTARLLTVVSDALHLTARVGGRLLLVRVHRNVWGPVVCCSMLPHAMPIRRPPKGHVLSSAVLPDEQSAERCILPGNPLVVCRFQQPEATKN